MANQKRPGSSGGNLRRKAEQRLGQSASRPRGGKAETSLADSLRLLHELKVHQVELEVQNEELKNTRAQVEAGLARYTEVFDFAPIGYATLTTAGLIESINHAGARMLGQPRGALLQRPFAIRLTSSSGIALANLVDAARASEAREEVEVETDPELGVSRRLRLWATALARPEPLVLLAFDDISERKLKDEALARTEQALRESNRRKDEFLAMLSHELRNPLAPIRNCLYLLSRVEPGCTQARRAQAIIEQQVAHLARLVDDLLDVTRITKGQIRLHVEPVSLTDVVGKTLEAHRAIFDGKGIVLRVSIEPGEHWVSGDSTRLVQAVSNVLGNAEKFTPRGGTVTVGLRRQNKQIALEIRDTGIGIAPEVSRHLFEPFSQAPQTMERASGGLGLGLAMVKGLVELHGGSVTLTSEGLGRGSTVTMMLPTAEAPAPAAKATNGHAGATHRILIIEDNHDAAESLRDALSLEGHDVQVAYDGQTGIATARWFKPSMVICDIGLPGMDGYEVASRIRADEMLRATYLIALTGYARPEDLERANRAGFQQHVAKPPTMERLLGLVGSVPAPADRPDAPTVAH